MFAEISDPQWLWYFYNCSKDKEEYFEAQRDFVEYHASFIEPQSVKKIREGRESKVEVNDNDFAESVKQLFGRDVDLEKPQGFESKIHTTDINQTLRNMKEKPKKE